MLSVENPKQTQELQAALSQASKTIYSACSNALEAIPTAVIGDGSRVKIGEYFGVLSNCDPGGEGLLFADGVDIEYSPTAMETQDIHEQPRIFFQYGSFGVLKKIEFWSGSAQHEVEITALTPGEDGSFGAMSLGVSRHEYDEESQLDIPLNLDRSVNIEEFLANIVRKKDKELTGQRPAGQALAEEIAPVLDQALADISYGDFVYTPTETIKDDEQPLNPQDAYLFASRILEILDAPAGKTNPSPDDTAKGRHFVGFRHKDFTVGGHRVEFSEYKSKRPDLARANAVAMEVTSEETIGDRGYRKLTRYEVSTFSYSTSCEETYIPNEENRDDPPSDDDLKNTIFNIQLAIELGFMSMNYEKASQALAMLEYCQANPTIRI